MSTFDDIASGLNVGLSLRNAYDTRKSNKAAQAEIDLNKKNAKAKQELIVGLQTKIAGGGEGAKQARLDLVSQHPVEAGKFFSSFKQMPRPEQEAIKNNNMMLGKTAEQLLQVDDENLDGSLLQYKTMFENQGNKKLASRVDDLIKLSDVDKKDVRQRLKAMSVQAQDMKQVLAGGNNEQQKEFRKEERQVARTSVTNLNKRALSISGDFDKVEKMLSQKSRSANASVLQVIARLASPGIVTQDEAGALAGGAAPLAALATKFDDKGHENLGDLIRKSIDPNNPTNFDYKGLLTLAKALTGAEVPHLLKSLEDAKSRAKTANISKQAWDTNFSDKNTALISGLSRFVTPKEPTVVDAGDGFSVEYTQ